ncbi:hypothetical protein N8T08_004627 [Aspergillus melleus]|uniref:Uncharacterized protein n=1 Tax=Aspergillus melleus TaxID=138277 RepID=A0ACC3B5H3_9EURO|nr:hypothetical protein N8T08_004627 [Aspergillus melleus]
MSSTPRPTPQGSKRLIQAYLTVYFNALVEYILDLEKRKEARFSDEFLGVHPSRRESTLLRTGNVLCIVEVAGIVATLYDPRTGVTITNEDPRAEFDYDLDTAVIATSSLSGPGA